MSSLPGINLNFNYYFFQNIDNQPNFNVTIEQYLNLFPLFNVHYINNIFFVNFTIYFNFITHRYDF
jgi:hypothetical protein